MKPLSFWGYVREREAIRVKRASGALPPWTKDQVLRNYSFTNVRRIDDPDTARSIEMLEDGSRTPFEFVWRAYALRCLNRAETFEKYGLPYPRGFAAWRAKIDAAMARGEPVGARQHLTFWAHAKIALERLTPDVARRVHFAPSGIAAIEVLAKHRPPLYVGPYLGTLIVGETSPCLRASAVRSDQILKCRWQTGRASGWRLSPRGSMWWRHTRCSQRKVRRRVAHGACARAHDKQFSSASGGSLT